MRCPTCQLDCPSDAAFCAGCGQALRVADPSLDPTVAGDPGAIPPTQTPTRGERHVPGSVIAERYRIVGLLGRGGMGEVYRADDLKLGQPVALKFLPQGLESDPRRLELLNDEVRVARQVAHPNVCRVYDVGEANGHHFICMEYVDGEDLSTLLRRIGHLPPAKAAQIGRQICAGLAAAHEQGIVHRDLKPANVMIDGKGRARITDFGLAREATQVEGRASRDGTPAYMAPEQLAGREATALSDIYALGLVLYELFTGQQPFRARTLEQALQERSSGAPSSPASHVDAMDPAAERAILRCLEADPSMRLPSALSVAAALPGGDPLAAALAAGETPSPDVVAATPTEGTVSPWVAYGLVLFCLVGVVGSLGLAYAVGLVPGGSPPIVLADRARQMLQELGHETAGHDEAWGYEKSAAMVSRLRDMPAESSAAIEGETPPVYPFWYRSAAGVLMPDLNWNVTSDDPPPTMPSSALLVLHTDGRLVRLEIRPAEARVRTGSSAVDTDWDKALTLAGLQREQLVPVDPLHAPPTFADEIVAWTDSYPTGMQRRIEGAALDGKVVWLNVFSPELAAQEEKAEAQVSVFFVLLYFLFAGVLGAGLWLARKNYRSGRGDRRGALRLAIVIGTAWFLGSFLGSKHALVPQEFDQLWGAIRSGAVAGAVTAMFYLGLEPFLRRNWPHRIVAWTRLLDGRFRDPLVGRELLAGAVGGAVFVGSPVATHFVVQILGLSRRPFGVESVVPLGQGVPGALAVWWQALAFGTLLSLGVAVMIFCAVYIVRNAWIGGASYVLLFLFGLTMRDGLFDEPALILVASIPLAVTPILLLRFGLLAMATGLVLGHLKIFYPVTRFDGEWFSGAAPVLWGTIVAVAVYGAWACARREGSGAASDASRP